jgi:four helix bundle protein
MSGSGRDIEDRAFKLACAAVTFCNSGWQVGEIQARLFSHLSDASTSIGANLEEAAAGQTKRDFITKVANAHKGARQTRFWLRLIATCFPQHQKSITPLSSVGVSRLERTFYVRRLAFDVELVVTCRRRPIQKIRPIVGGRQPAADPQRGCLIRRPETALLVTA